MGKNLSVGPFFPPADAKNAWVEPWKPWTFKLKNKTDEQTKKTLNNIFFNRNIYI